MRTEGHNILISSVGITIGKMSQLSPVGRRAKTVNRDLRHIPRSNPIPLAPMRNPETARYPPWSKFPQRLSNRHRLDTRRILPLGGYPNRHLRQLKITEQGSGQEFRQRRTYDVRLKPHAICPTPASLQSSKQGGYRLRHEGTWCLPQNGACFVIING